MSKYTTYTYRYSVFPSLSYFFCWNLTVGSHWAIGFVSSRESNSLSLEARAPFILFPTIWELMREWPNSLKTLLISRTHPISTSLIFLLFRNERGLNGFDKIRNSILFNFKKMLTQCLKSSFSKIKCGIYWTILGALILNKAHNKYAPYKARGLDF